MFIWKPRDNQKNKTTEKIHETDMEDASNTRMTNPNGHAKKCWVIIWLGTAASLDTSKNARALQRGDNY
jgi:hypothetical protein